MSDSLSPILQWINAHPDLAGLATFTISTAESVAIIGTIIPGSVMMTAIGTLAGIGIIPLWETIIWAILGAIVGDGISYWIGRKFNTRLPYVWPFRTHPNLLQNGETFFVRHGWMSVFIGRFVGPVRALVPLVAGMLGMRPLRFTIANVLSAILWAPAYMLPGILIGTASLELPPDIAIHVILMLILTLLGIMLCVWLVHRVIQLIGKQISHQLTKLWSTLSDSPYFSFITTSLKHHDPNQTYGQLTLAFYFITISCLLLYLTFYIHWYGSEDIFINQVFFHLFRSLRTPFFDNIMLAITFLGEKKVLLPLALTLFAWLAYCKRWYTAWHVLALGLMAGGGIEVLKWLAHSPRPWGVLQSPESYSFPSGHTTLTTAFYLGITLLFLEILQIKSRRVIFYIVGTFILTISFSRLYLGVHWFTDVVGGWLLGSATLILVCLSYNRQREEKLQPLGIILTILLTLTVSYSLTVDRNYAELHKDYQQLDWPQYNIPLDAWWNQQGDHLPLYRLNRFGSTFQLLNLQWMGNLSDIETVLLKNGWSIPPKTDWIGILHRVADVRSAEHLPLVAPLYLDKAPELELIKTEADSKRLLVLRLWNANLILTNAKQPLWVGSVELSARTYSWVFKRRNQVTLTPDLLFIQSPDQYVIKQVMVQLKHGFRPQTQPLILIKPK